MTLNLFFPRIKIPALDLTKMATDSSTVKGPKTSPLCQFEAILGARMKTEGPTIGSKCVWSKGVHIFPECLAAMYRNSREVHIFPERFVIFKASLFMGFTCIPGANDLRSVGWSSSYKSVWLWSPRLKKSRVQCSAGEAELQITTVNLILLFVVKSLCLWFSLLELESHRMLISFL